jgi:hypothetical protein
MTKHSDARRRQRLAKLRQARQIRPRLEVLEDRVVPTVYTVNSSANTGGTVGAGNAGTLQQCLNSATAPGDIIVFSSTVAGQTLNLSGPLNTITNSNVTIDDTGASGGSAVAFTINGGTTTNEIEVGSGGGLTIKGGGNLSFINGKGFNVTGTTIGGGAFEVAAGGTLDISNTNISGNTATGTATDPIALGGAIYNAGTLTLTSDTLTGNLATTSQGGAAGGGAVYNAPGASLVNSTGNTVSGNKAINSGGGTGGVGGGAFLDQGSRFSLASSTISGNTAESIGTATGGALGGGIASTTDVVLALSLDLITGNAVTNLGAATLTVGGGGLAISGAGTVNQSTVSGNSVSTENNNSAAASGGGIQIGFDGFNGAVLTLTNSTVNNNTASSSNATAGLEGYGGGIAVGAVDSGGASATLNATNDTIFGNAVDVGGGAQTAYGGGIAETQAASLVKLINDTITQNTLTGGTGTTGAGIANGIGFGAGTLNLLNTIVYDPAGIGTNPEVSGTIANAQNNWFGGLASQVTITNNIGGNQFGNPNISATLGANGGPVQGSTGSPLMTVSESSTSLTVDAGASNTSAKAVFGTNPVPSTDQRGDARPDNGETVPDIGAFEFQDSTPTPTPTVLPTTVTGLSVTDSFGPFNQVETVSGTVSDGGTAVSSGNVTISDAGQTQTVGVNPSGGFSATFTFNLFQEFSTAPSHIVNVSYGGATVGTTTFSPSSGSTTSANNTFGFLFQILLFEELVAALRL